MNTITIDRAVVEQALEALEDAKALLNNKDRTTTMWFADEITALRDALAQQDEPNAHGYASRLAFAIWNKHYKDIAPQWKPLDDLMGVLTQIDNMTSGLTLLAQQAEPVQEPEGMVEFLADLQRSRTKYPKNRRMFDGLMGEIDELRRAYAGDGDIRAEAFDVAVCAFRIATEGDAGGNARLEQDEPVEPVAWINALKDAFFEGFTSVATYNDTLLNSPEEAWGNYKPPRPAPAQAADGGGD